MIKDAELGGPVDRRGLDLRSVSVRRAGGRLRVTFETVEQPGEAEILRFVASNSKGTRSVVFEARFRGSGAAEGLYRPPSGERRPASLRRRGTTVTVQGPADSLTSDETFRWQARVISLRGVPEVVDRLPGVRAHRLHFPR